MRFTQTLFAGAALVAAAFAVEINSIEPTNPEAGKTAIIKYSPGGNTPTEFILRKGDPNALDNLTTITQSATSGTFTWNVPTNLEEDDDYAITIIQGGESNFWGPFKITGGKAVSSASSSASASASSSGSVTKSASLTTATSSVSGAASSSGASNGTVSSATLSTGGASNTRAPATSTGTGGVPEQTGAAVALGSSPFALIAGVVGAMAYLN
ncbi:hypothetical protein EJ04DRAFT_439468 [Polyplosphaeria fusca]|uniref:Yeast cell wall synthesis Kre9/Knh1-like N-terminal domain-containing protein n=1 Tax=Polyplosphaeria fusca TaxID=682080 RepID=A0A9P4V1I7_9PLEO|nr:hypothetical protein EJ04DRAFT_439468 [Polyplosphaeria fusca]